MFVANIEDTNYPKNVEFIFWKINLKNLIIF